MDDTAAAAAPGCDGDEPQPQEESTTAVASGCDASSPPSTSNPNPPSPDSSFMSGLEEDYDNNCFNDDFMQGVEIPKPPFVGDTEPLSSLAAEFQSGSPIIQEKIKLLSENYAALRRTRGDGNCFYRSFMFSYLEHILVTQDKAEVDRVLVNIDQCKENLCSLGYAEFTYEDFFGLFIELLDSCLPGTKASLSLSELLEKTRDQMISDCAVMFFRFITSAEMQKSAEFFEPFIAGLTNNSSVVQFCKAAVEPMGEESDHVHVTALSNALGVPIRVVYLDRSCDSGNPTINHHDFIPCANNDIQNNDSKGGTDATNGSTDLGEQEKPDPFVTLLYRPGHYDILYPM